MKRSNFRNIMDRIGVLLSTKRYIKEKDNMDFSNLSKLDLSKIKMVDFPKEQYYQTVHPKKQIVLHHTVSGVGVEGDLRSWLATASRIATAIIIDREGVIWQCFSSKHWGHHIGVKSTVLKSLDIAEYRTQNLKLNKESISIELDNWGWLTKDGDKYKAAYGNTVRGLEITEYPDEFRGKQYFESYSYKQLKTLGEILLFWNNRYDIPLDYNEDMWDISKDALMGKSGVWTHVSYRPFPEDHLKTDCHPDPNLISLLKSLKNQV